MNEMCLSSDYSVKCSEEDVTHSTPCSQEATHVCIDAGVIVQSELIKPLSDCLLQCLHLIFLVIDPIMLVFMRQR